jgi:hypothetical protein
VRLAVWYRLVHRHAPQAAAAPRRAAPRRAAPHRAAPHRTAPLQQPPPTTSRSHLTPPPPPFPRPPARPLQVGGIMRTALGMGACGLILSPTSADPLCRKSVSALPSTKALSGG